MRKSLFSRAKASVVSMALAVTTIPACLAPAAANAVVNTDLKLTSQKTAGNAMSVDSVIKGTVPENGAKTISFTIETEYDQKFTYGLGVELNKSPYWTEHNSKGDWDAKGSGFEVSLKKGSNTITVDLSDLDLKSGGNYEFRCYYSSHYQASAGDMVENEVTLTGVEFDASTITLDPDPNPDPDPPNPSIEPHNRQSGDWSFKDNKDGTATITSTVTRQLDELDILLTRGYDEDYYALHPDEFTEDAPINSHKFTYADFGLTNVENIIVESLTVTVESDAAFDQFMYGGGMNVKQGSDADTEYAKRLAELEGKEGAGYWYNDMGKEQLEDFVAQGVKFLIDDIGTGTTLEGAGTYIEAYWEPPKSVQECMATRLTDAVSFQFWYGSAAETEEYTELDTCTITSAALTYTIQRTVPYTGTLSAAIDQILSHADTKANSVEIPYADLKLQEDMDVYAIKFEVIAETDIEKFVYGIGTGTLDKESDYWFQEDGNYVVLNAGQTAEVMWIVPAEAAGSNSATNLINPDGNIYIGYYYGAPDSVKVSNVEVYYEQPKTMTTTTTTSTTTTTTTTAPPKPVKIKWGDANCNDEVRLNDAVLIMQSLGNPDLYGINGTESSHITEQGILNGDVYDNGTGLTNQDALQIQKYLIHLINTLDPFAEE